MRKLLPPAVELLTAWLALALVTSDATEVHRRPFGSGFVCSPRNFGSNHGTKARSPSMDIRMYSARNVLAATRHIIQKMSQETVSRFRCGHPSTTSLLAKKIIEDARQRYDSIHIKTPLMHVCVHSTEPVGNFRSEFREPHSEKNTQKRSTITKKQQLDYLHQQGLEFIDLYGHIRGESIRCVGTKEKRRTLKRKEKA